MTPEILNALTLAGVVLLILFVAVLAARVSKLESLRPGTLDTLTDTLSKLNRAEVAIHRLGTIIYKDDPKRCRWCGCDLVSEKPNQGRLIIECLNCKRGEAR